MGEKLSGSAQRVQDALKAAGSMGVVIEHEKTTRTAKDAAEAIGCSVGQIVKSLIFRTKISGQGVLVITSGINRVDEAHVTEALGEVIEKADAAFVETVTGYAIGGIPPLAHRTRLITLIDQDLMQYGEIWAAAGTPNAVFKTNVEELASLTEGKIIKVTKD